MASDPSWDDIFGPTRTAPTTAPAPSAPDDPAALPSRRALRDGGAPAGGSGPAPRTPRKRKRRGGGAIAWIIATVVVLALLVGGGVTVWVMFEDKIRDVLGIAPPIDYTTTGNGEEAIVVIQPGDIGSDVATTLRDAGVTMTFQAFYELLLDNPDVTFEPGNYRLQKEMSAASALAALQDPANRIINQVTIREGISAASALELIAAATEIPLDQLQAEAANFTQFGVPANAPSIEGFLFPATYTFDPGISAHDAIKTLVDKMLETLDAAGVAPENRFTVITMASIIQRESGPVVEDMAKISRVFQNRLDRGMNLQSDATVHYGLGDTSSVWTSAEARADASNPYNTYANPGLPIGPIGLPGADAINAALHPADGGWLYFVTVNLRTGETVFSNTLAEHERAADQLYAWCKESDENAAYCA
ncbi:endolytic transglycosylase MltG [Protaetiibacter intestinalis]|uniref:Endolytic murein transglycosylase n=1 Tax=Protaetiibacter intestinalis TaxID=2419774 RepID=A0A387B9Q5_9MICO|nr:endolytic transglycosylase MltG [Protaetiibacter intestinalis]AYF99117.1 endolytic transglycosylase MltG [Protaetiibacter intestinalis]